MEKDFFAAYLIELLRKRFLILLAGLICAVITFICCKFIVINIFECSAQVYVREKPNYTNAERDQISPITFESLLKSTSLIKEVLQEYCKKTGNYKLMLELFIKEFKVKTKLIEDTTIKKKLSPVIDISVRANSRENAKLLMDIWTTLFIKHYGDVVARDAEYVADYFEQRLSGLQKRLDEKEKEYSDVKWQLPLKIKELADAEDLLSPGQSFYPMIKEEPQILGPYNLQDIKVNVQPTRATEVGRERERAGLREKLKLTDIKIEVAKANGENVKAIKAERDAIEQTIKKTADEIKILQTEAANLERKYEAMGREVETLRQEYKLTSLIYSQTDLEARAIKKEGRTSLEGSDVLIVSPSAMPDKRVFPRLTLFTGLSFILGMLICIIVIVIRKYVKDSEKELNKQQ